MKTGANFESAYKLMADYKALEDDCERINMSYDAENCNIKLSGVQDTLMKISCRADFPKISRTLVIDADFDGDGDGDASVWVMDSDKVQLLALEKFNDLDSAIDYYVAQYLSFADKEGVE